jgi:hypothetical protein
MGVVHLDKWIEKIRRCEFLQEDELKALCEYVSLRVAGADAAAAAGGARDRRRRATSARARAPSLAHALSDPTRHQTNKNNR